MSDLSSELRQRISDHGQDHILAFWSDLGEKEQCEFGEQLESVDFELFTTLRQQLSDQSQATHTIDLEPCPYISLDALTEIASLRDQGIEIIRNGELGVLTVAGGQGTRLGWSGPKGTFPATPITGKSLFQVIAEKILFATRAYGVSIPWYIMTSQENEAITRSFLLDNNCFGLTRTEIIVFTQGMVPAIDADGNMLLAAKNKIAMNPDGHGGVLDALQQSGGLAEMNARGIKHLSYIQVDNPLAKVIDPIFLALHATDKDSSAEVSSKCVEKTNPEERVGVFCLVDGRTTVVEYSDFPSEKMTLTDQNGALTYRAGSIAIHLLSTAFLQRIADDLPWHIAHKKVSYLSVHDGSQVDPETPNAYKFERFVFDVLQFARRPLVVESSRAEEFAPIKNASGIDSPATSHLLQQERAARWLRTRGVEVSPTAIVELSPLTCASPEDLDADLLPKSISDAEVVTL